MVRFASTTFAALLFFFSGITALPQASLSTTGTSSASTTTPSPAVVSNNPMVFPPFDPTKQPIPGAQNNDTLLTVAPQLNSSLNRTSTTPGQVPRDVDAEMEKRFTCPNIINPWAPDWMWRLYAINFCNHFFPGTGDYYVKAGFCFTGVVPKSPPTPELDFTYCAKNPNVPYPVFIAITNSICIAQFTGIVSYDVAQWSCPAYQNGRVHGGDNSDQIHDSSNWKLEAK